MFNVLQTTGVYFLNVCKSNFSFEISNTVFKYLLYTNRLIKSKYLFPHTRLVLVIIHILFDRIATFHLFSALARINRTLFIAIISCKSDSFQDFSNIPVPILWHDLSLVWLPIWLCSVVKVSSILTYSGK